MIALTLMYRDGSNFKTSETYYYGNKKRLPHSRIEAALNKLGMDSFIPEYYDIYDHPAPLGNEFLPIPPGNEDHSFVELVDWSFINDNTKPEYDISCIVRSVESPELVQQRRRAAHKEAIQSVLSDLQSLINMDV